jgi:hypothetical protein
MPERNRFVDFAAGVMLTFGMHILAGILLSLIASIASALNIYTIVPIPVFFVLGIGITQLVYIIPVAILLARKREWEKMKGVILGAVITALLNGGCWLFAMSIR